MTLGILSGVVFGILITMFCFALWWNKKLGVDPLTGEDLPDKPATDEALTSKKRSDD